jgi:hypothetical protein
MSSLLHPPEPRNTTCTLNSQEFSVRAGSALEQDRERAGIFEGFFLWSDVVASLDQKIFPGRQGRCGLCLWGERWNGEGSKLSGSAPPSLILTMNDIQTARGAGCLDTGMQSCARVCGCRHNDY